MESVRIFLRQQIAAVWRHRWLALAASWLICGIGWAAVSLMPNQFESSARVYVNVDAVLTPLAARPGGGGRPPPPRLIICSAPCSANRTWRR